MISAQPVEERGARLAALDEAIPPGLADIAAGRTKPLEEVAARLQAQYRAMAEGRT